jgi:predicted amidohydrolase YtcJ
MHADVVLQGGTIVTQDQAQPTATSIAIAGDKIIALDGDARAAIAPRTRAIELRGKAVVPGFVDAHIHFGSFALTRQQVELDSAPTLADGARALQTAAASLPDEAWLSGRGWDRNRWGRLPTASDLDVAIGDRPALLISHDGHAMWLSSAAMRAVGLDRTVADPPGGVIERDEHGQPTGVLFENAQDLVRSRMPKPTHDELCEAIRRALPVAAEAGMTGIHNLEDRRSRAAFATIEAAGELSLRVYHGVARAELASAKDDGVTTESASDWLRIGPLKLFSDGALGSRTAHLLEPYEQRSDGYRGVPTMQPAELEDAMRHAADAHLDIAVHAIGDAAVRTVLDTFERMRAHHPEFANRILRIEHAQLVHPDDVPRFAQLGVIASMQPIHAAADWRTADAHWGARSHHGYAWRSLLDAGATLAFGTDAPVERIEPLLNLYAATTRHDLNGEPQGGWYPEQRISLPEAVRAYTYGSAIAERAADRRGSLSIGKDADLVVLEPDPFTRDVDLREVRVVMTMVGGRIVYEGEMGE